MQRQPTPTYASLPVKSGSGRLPTKAAPAPAHPPPVQMVFTSETPVLGMLTQRVLRIRGLLSFARILAGVIGLAWYFSSDSNSPCTAVFWIKPSHGEVVGKLDQPAVSSKIGEICPLLEISTTMLIVGTYMLTLLLIPHTNDLLKDQMKYYYSPIIYLQVWAELNLQLIVLLPLAGANDIYEIVNAVVITTAEVAFVVLSDVCNASHWFSNDIEDVNEYENNKENYQYVRQETAGNYFFPIKFAFIMYFSKWLLILVHLIDSMAATSYRTSVRTNIGIFLVFALLTYNAISKYLQIKRASRYRSYRFCVVNGECAVFLASLVILLVLF